MGIRKFVLIV